MVKMESKQSTYKLRIYDMVLDIHKTSLSVSNFDGDINKKIEEFGYTRVDPADIDKSIMEYVSSMYMDDRGIIIHVTNNRIKGLLLYSNDVIDNTELIKYTNGIKDTSFYIKDYINTIRLLDFEYNSKGEYREALECGLTLRQLHSNDHISLDPTGNVVHIVAQILYNGKYIK